MYFIFKVPNEKKSAISEALSDELVSKQSASIRDGESLGFDEDITYVLIEGSQKALEKAEDIFSEKDIEKIDEGEDIFKAIKKADEDAAAGVGTIFG